MSRRTLAHLLLLGVVLAWGMTFVVVKAALAQCTPLLFNLLRMALATLALVAVNRKALCDVPRAHWLGGAVAGIFLAAGYQLQTAGLARTTPAKSAFLTGLVVVFVPVLTMFPRLRPPGTRGPGPATGVGALLAFAGLLLLTTPAGTTTRMLAHAIGLGDLLTLGCALAFAAHLLTLARVSPGMAAGRLATLQIGFATLVMLGTLPFERPHLHLTASLTATLLVTGLICTAAAFTIQSFAQQVLPPTHTVVLLTLEPVFAWLTAWLWLGERLDSRSLVGAALILAGIAVIELLPATHSTEMPA